VPLAAPGLPGEGGYRLHAERLVLDHPATGRRLEIECAPPPPLTAPPAAVT
jgi:23S rRNA pseudouridine1911/1915/1917 synthase